MLDAIKQTLGATADKLRANMDAAGYKHLVRVQVKLDALIRRKCLAWVVRFKAQQQGNRNVAEC